MSPRLEHANITVPSIDRTSAFLRTVFPDFVARGGGFLHGDPERGRWLHVGNQDSYLALQENASPRSLYQDTGVNHLGFVVDDVDAVISRLSAAGYAPSDDSSLDSHPSRRRVYYLDQDGFEWEFVGYLSEDPAVRHQFDVAGPWSPVASRPTR